MLLGDVLASAAVGTAITAVAVVGLIALLGLAVPHPIVLGVGIALAALGFSSLGVLMATIPTDQTSDVMMLATLVKFPVIFVSGIFVPVENLPVWGQLLAYVSPLTYLVQTTQYGFGHTTGATVWIAGLVVFLAGAFVLAVALHRRTLPVRVS
ncbi:MAG: ABC-2 type transport system permease protein [Halobacteriales archaeon]|jgi:ABC-2 type transport system permease protein